jgi:hypothetical protein
MADLNALGDETLVEYTADGLSVELCFAGEGDDGCFDACVDDDRPLLRFYAAAVDANSGAWEELGGCTACTGLTADDDPVALVAVARRIHERLRFALPDAGSLRAACDHLSGVTADDARTPALALG